MSDTYLLIAFFAIVITIALLIDPDLASKITELFHE